MAKIVKLVTPIIFAFANSKEVKNLVLALMERYVVSTKTSIDNEIFMAVKSAIFKPES
jgi:hypothetical protein